MTLRSPVHSRRVGATYHDLPQLLVEGLKSGGAELPIPDATSQQTLSGGAVMADAAAARDGPLPFYGSISLAETLELYRVVRELRPSASVEIGLCCGASSIAILQALADEARGIHHACDPFQASFSGQGLVNVEACGLGDRFRFHEAFPESVLPSLGPLDFAFIDASHLFDLSILDFVLIDKRLVVGGVVGLHDVWLPSLRRLVRYAMTNRGYELYPGEAGALRPTPTERCKSAVARVARAIPRSSRIFTADVLHPWHEVAGSRDALLFLRKTREDDRGWRFHEPF